MLARAVDKDHSRPWNKGLLIGQKKLLQPKHVWSTRVRLEIASLWRDLALFNLAIDSKLRACDLVKLPLDEVFSGAKAGIGQRSFKRTPTTSPVRDHGADEGLVTNAWEYWLSISLPKSISCTASRPTASIARCVVPELRSLGRDAETESPRCHD
jgi:hypothetical protein